MTLRMIQLWSLLEADISYSNSHCLNQRLVSKISEQLVDGAKVSGIFYKQFSRLCQGFFPDMIKIFILQGRKFSSPYSWNVTSEAWPA